MKAARAAGGSRLPSLSTAQNEAAGIMLAASSCRLEGRNDCDDGGGGEDDGELVNRGHDGLGGRGAADWPRGWQRCRSIVI